MNKRSIISVTVLLMLLSVKLYSLTDNHKELLQVNQLLKDWKTNEAFSKLTEIEESKLAGFTIKESIYYTALKGKMLLYLRKYNQSIKYLDKAIKEHINYYGNQDSILAYLYNNQGINYLQIGVHDSAIVYFNNSLKIKEKYFVQNHKTFISSNNNLGILYRRTAQYERSLSAFSKAENIYVKNNRENDIRYGMLLLNKAVLLRNLGRIVEALNYYKLASNVLSFYSDYDKLYGLNLNIGGLYLNIGEYEKANGSFNKALKLETDNNIIPSPTLYLNMGLCYQNLENTKKAIELYNKGLRLFEKNDDVVAKENKIKIFQNLGDLYLGKEEYNKAFKNYNKALKVSKNYLGEKHVLTAHTYAQIGDYYKTISENRKALEQYDFALQCFTKDKLKPGGDKLTYINMLSKKALALKEMAITADDEKTQIESLKLYSEAAELINKLQAAYLNESSRLRFIKKETEILSNGLEVAYNLYDKTGETEYLSQAFLFSEYCKSSALNASLNDARAMIKGNIPDSLLELEKQLQTQILYYQNLLESDNDEKIRSELVTIYGKREKLINYFEDNYSDYYQLKYKPLVVSLKETQSELQQNEVLIEYSLTGYNLYTFCITSSSVNVVKSEVDSLFYSNLYYLHNFINYNSWVTYNSEYFTRYKEAGYSLYKTLLYPFRNEIQDKRTIIIPDAELNLIPFEILLVNDDKSINDYGSLSYFIKQTPVSYKYSAITSKYLEKETKYRKNYLASFAPNYKEIASNASNVERSKLSNLKGALDEINEISRFFSGEEFIGSLATESNFKSVINSFSIIHLAMHAIIDDKNPMLSKLVFSDSDKEEDGDLNMYEIYNMKLNPDLLVLSACNTGNGDLYEGEGVLSLARGFVNAGCPSLVMTLWPINDITGSQLMKHFYKHLSDGINKDEALRNAKMDYLKISDPLKRHPFYWAGYVNIGDSDKIIIQKNNLIQQAAVSFFSVLLFVSALIFAIRKTKRNYKCIQIPPAKKV